jgi:hypothetical protein
MKRRILFFVAALAIGQGVFAQAKLEITLEQGTPDEARTVIGRSRDARRKLTRGFGSRGAGLRPERMGGHGSCALEPVLPTGRWKQ